MFCCFAGVLCILFVAENLYFELQINRKLEHCRRIKNCFRRAAKNRSIRTAKEPFICKGVPLFAARKFFLKPLCGPSCSQSWTTLNKIAKGRAFSALDLKSAFHQIHLHEKDQEFTAFQACDKLFPYRRLPCGVTIGVSVFQRMIDSIIEKYKHSGTYAYLDNVTVVGTYQADHDRRLEAFLRAAEAENLTLNDARCETNKTEIDLVGCRVSHNLIRPNPERLKRLLNLPLPPIKR